MKVMVIIKFPDTFNVQTKLHAHCLSSSVATVYFFKCYPFITALFLCLHVCLLHTHTCGTVNICLFIKTVTRVWWGVRCPLSIPIPLRYGLSHNVEHPFYTTWATTMSQTSSCFHPTLHCGCGHGQEVTMNDLLKRCRIRTQVSRLTWVVRSKFWSTRLLRKIS